MSDKNSHAPFTATITIFLLLSLASFAITTGYNVSQRLFIIETECAPENNAQ